MVSVCSGELQLQRVHHEAEHAYHHSRVPVHPAQAHHDTNDEAHRKGVQT
jgi:hypothetical protein